MFPLFVFLMFFLSLQYMLTVSLFPSNAHTRQYELCIVEIINQFLPDGREQSPPPFFF